MIQTPVDPEQEITTYSVPQEVINALARSHPVPSEEKLLRRMARLERMARFYDEKAPDAPEKQAMMFKGFVSALLYAMTMIKMYRKLTKKLAESSTAEAIIKELEDEAGTDSEG